MREWLLHCENEAPNFSKSEKEKGNVEAYVTNKTPSTLSVKNHMDVIHRVMMSRALNYMTCESGESGSMAGGGGVGVGRVGGGVGGGEEGQGENLLFGEHFELTPPVLFFSI